MVYDLIDLSLAVGRACSDYKVESIQWRALIGLFRKIVSGRAEVENHAASVGLGVSRRPHRSSAS